MKELLILDEPEHKGYAWSNKGDFLRDSEHNWRPATRRERWEFAFTRPRFSIRYLVMCVVVYVLLRVVWDFVA